MPHTKQRTAFITSIEQSLLDETFVKLTLTNYKGNEPALKNVYVKKVIIKEQDKLSFTCRFKTRDIVKNYSINEGILTILDYLNSGFKGANLFTLAYDLQLEQLAEQEWKTRKLKASHTSLPDATHDRTKKRHLEANASVYLHDLHITSADGLVLKNAQDKYKQINHYIELVSTLLNDLPKDKELKVVDMGSGKGYLTFALYDYLQHKLHITAHVTGVEYRQDLVKLCNDIAIKNKFNGLHFAQGSIEEYECNDVNILIALHACDTATDDAIYKGIMAKADLIVVAPCCHKQIRNEIEQGKKQNDLDFILRHGIYLEREAEMITDSLRALILEYAGYRTKVFEFISEAHTPKNIMIVAEQKQRPKPADALRILQKIKNAKSYFGIHAHHLEKRLGIESNESGNAADF